MGFDYSDIRLSMDVYTLDNVYLGTVLDVSPGTIMHEGIQVPPGARQGSEVSGEEFGPMPTEHVGNPGPVTQSARFSYATKAESARPIGRGALRVGKWWGLLGKRTIPMDAVQTVSLERVVLRWKEEELVRELGE